MKTAEMKLLEYQDAERRGKRPLRRRDIRDIIAEALAAHGSLRGAAATLGLGPSGLWRWIGKLGGAWDQETKTLRFDGYDLGPLAVSSRPHDLARCEREAQELASRAE